MGRTKSLATLKRIQWRQGTPRAQAVYSGLMFVPKCAGSRKHTSRVCYTPQQQYVCLAKGGKGYDVDLEDSAFWSDNNSAEASSGNEIKVCVRRKPVGGFFGFFPSSRHPISFFLPTHLLIACFLTCTRSMPCLALHYPPPNNAPTAI